MTRIIETLVVLVLLPINWIWMIVQITLALPIVAVNRLIDIWTDVQ